MNSDTIPSVRSWIRMDLWPSRDGGSMIPIDLSANREGGSMIRTDPGSRSMGSDPGIRFRDPRNCLDTKTKQNTSVSQSSPMLAVCALCRNIKARLSKQQRQRSSSSARAHYHTKLNVLSASGRAQLSRLRRRLRSSIGPIPPVHGGPEFATKLAGGVHRTGSAQLDRELSTTSDCRARAQLWTAPAPPPTHQELQ